MINIRMESLFKRVIFLFTFNLTLLLILMVGIQNSSTKRKVNLLTNKTISLPIGFITGVSFISGSLVGGFLKTNFNYHKK